MAIIEGVLETRAPGQRIKSLALPGSLLFACIALILGIADAGLLVGWHQIDPDNLSWFRGDAAVYQAGWEFLRRQAWTFPPTWLGHLDYPFGISGAYLDFIPIVAVPMHLLAGFLPADFQYLGVYAAACLILQAWFGMKLLSCFTTDRILIVVGALFFLDSPILLMRLYGHFALCSQWLILAALYCYFRPVDRADLVSYLAPFAILLAVAGGITPYIAVMVLMIGLAALFRAHLETQIAGAIVECNASVLQRFLQTNEVLLVAILIGSMLASFVFFGFITFGDSPTLEGKGYGMFSMNLLSPVAAVGRSAIFNAFRVFPNQEYEGYNYLGLGVVLLGIACIVRRPAVLTKLWSPSLRPLVIASVLLALVALSVRVTFGQTVLFIVPVPPVLFNLLATFRASGRFFWPVYYLLMLGAVVGGALMMSRRWSRFGMLGAALVLQFVDTLPIRAAVKERTGTTVSDPLMAKDWISIAHTYRHLVILPARQCNSDLTPGGDAAWPWFARFAARNGMTLNSVYAARISSASEALNCVVLPRRIAAGNLDNDTAYILDDRLARLASDRSHTHTCRHVDGFNVCTLDRLRVLPSRVSERQLRALPNSGME